MKWTCVRAGLEDASLVADLSADTFRESWLDDTNEVDLEQHIAANYSLSVIEDELKDPSIIYLLVEADNTIAGYAKLQLNAMPEETIIENALAVHRIYLKKRFQNRGGGAMLMKEAMRIAKEYNLGKIWLGVWNENLAGIRFYERLGFKKAGTYKYVMGSIVSDDYLMCLELQ